MADVVREPLMPLLVTRDVQDLDAVSRPRARDERVAPARRDDLRLLARLVEGVRARAGEDAYLHAAEPRAWVRAARAPGWLRPTATATAVAARASARAARGSARVATGSPAAWSGPAATAAAGRSSSSARPSSASSPTCRHRRSWSGDPRTRRCRTAARAP